MRRFILASLLVAAAGCSTTHGTQKVDAAQSSEMFAHGAGTAPQQTANVSRQIETGAPGPTRGAPDGRR